MICSAFIDWFVVFFTSFAASYHEVIAILRLVTSCWDGNSLLGPRALKQSWKKVTTHSRNWKYFRLREAVRLQFRNRKVPYHIDIDRKRQNIVAKERNLNSILWDYIQKSKFLYSVNVLVYNSNQVARETMKSAMEDLGGPPYFG